MSIDKLASAHPSEIFDSDHRQHRGLTMNLLQGNVAAFKLSGPHEDKTYVATGLDVTYIPPDASDEELLKICAGMLHMTKAEREAFMSGEPSPELDRLIEHIHQAATESIDYMREELCFDFGYIYNEKKRIQKPSDIFPYMRRTTDFLRCSEKRKRALQVESADYCQFLSNVVARYELLKADMKSLNEESEYVHDIFYGRIQSAGVGMPTLELKHKQPTDTVHDLNMVEARVYLNGGILQYNSDSRTPGVIPVLTKGRGKRPGSLHSKTIRDPLYRASEAGKDGIGDIFECEKKQALPLALQLTSQLYGFPLNAENVVIENDGFYTDISETNALRDAFHTVYRQNSPRILSNSDNPNSGGYIALKIRANIYTEDAEGVPHRRNIELQIVTKGNDNNKGVKNWHVYEMVRKIAEVTRTRGAVPMKQFEMYLQKASEASGISEKRILEGITDRVSQVSGTRRGVMHIIGNSVYNRVRHIPGLVADAWIEKVMHAIEKRAPIALARLEARERQLQKGKK